MKNILKSFTKREIIASIIQILLAYVFAPIAGVIIYEIINSNNQVGEMLDKFVNDTVMNFASEKVPLLEEIDRTIKMISIHEDTETILQYFSDLVQTLETDLVVLAYIGMWIHASYVIFKELIPIPGIPLIQIIFGFVMGCLTINMFNDPVMCFMATAFLIILNIVLTIITPKSVLNKLFDIILLMTLQFFEVLATELYFITWMYFLSEGTTNLTMELQMFGTFGTIWLMGITIKYIFTMRKPELLIDK